MKMIMRFLKDYKKECVLAPLFKMLEAIFELFVPLVVSSVIDKGIVNADKGYIMQMCFMLILLAIIGLVCAITAQGCSWCSNRNETQFICTYPDILIHRDGYTWYIDTCNKNDK